MPQSNSGASFIFCLVSSSQVALVYIAVLWTPQHFSFQNLQSVRHRKKKRKANSKVWDWLVFSTWAPAPSPPLPLHPFNLLCSTEVHLHACLCKLQFLLNTTPNCRHMLEWSRCPSEAKWVTTAQRRLFWNQQPWCQAPTLSPQTSAESISWAPAPDGSQ